MLKFRYLFEDFDLAKTFLRLWPHDEETLDEMLSHYRISSSAVYPFYGSGKRYFLRFLPTSEVSEADCETSLSFIQYLRARGFGAMKPILSERGAYIERVEKNGETYIGCVFESVPGKRLDSIENIGLDLIEKYGRALGRLHNLSAEYRPETPARDYGDILTRIESMLTECGADEVAFAEAKAIREKMDSLPRTKQNFGMIHYDFEPDNVFYDAKTDEFYAIDFDDGMRNFFAIDVSQAIGCLDDCVPEEQLEQAQTAFLAGYRAEHGEDELIGSAVMERFVYLYGYARLSRASREVFENEPEWLVNCRQRIERFIAFMYGNFGKPL